MSNTKSKGLSLTVDRLEFLEAIKRVTPVARPGATLPVLRNVLLAVEKRRLKLQTTNLETSITTWTGLARGSKQGAITVPAHALAELVDLLPGDRLKLQAVDIDNENLQVICDGYRAKLKGIMADEFPEPELPEGMSIQLGAQALQTLLKQVTHYVAKDESVPALTGVLFRVVQGQLTVVATNRVCLALAVNQMDWPDLEVVIPLEALVILARQLNQAEAVELVLSDGGVLFMLPRLEITGRLLGDYPDYAAVMPQTHATQALLNRSELWSIIQAANQFSRHDSSYIWLEVSGNGDDGQVTISVSGPMVGDYQAEAMAEISGQPVKLAFYADQLVQGVKALAHEQVIVEIPSQDKAARPVTFRAGSGQQMIQPLSIE